MHKPSGRMLDIYSDMPCVFVDTAQDFPNYGNMLLKEEVLKVTNITTPIAKFGKNGDEQTASYISDENKSISDIELLMPENEQEGDYMMETPSMDTEYIQENGPILGKCKTVYTKHSGICIRPQLFPDAVTHVNISYIQINYS